MNHGSHWKKWLIEKAEFRFYAEMARVERRSVRTLRQKVQGMLYERTAISRKPDELARQELEAYTKSTCFMKTTPPKVETSVLSSSSFPHMLRNIVYIIAKANDFI